MDAVFFFKLILTFIAGSLWVTITTIIAERLGSQIGGWLGGMPGVVVISLFFIGLTQSADAAVQATTIIPLMVCFNGFFLVTYAFLAPYSFTAGLAGACAVWILPALTVSYFNWADYGVSLVICALGLVLWYQLLQSMKIRAQGQVKVPYTRTEVLGRAVFSGLIMVTAVVLSKVGGPILGGSFSAFPGVMLSTLAITHRTAGLEFSRAITKSLLVSGIINVVVYATAVRFVYPLAGLGLGTLAAYAISLVTGYLTFLFLQRNPKST